MPRRPIEVQIEETWHNFATSRLQSVPDASEASDANDIRRAWLEYGAEIGFSYPKAEAELKQSLPAQICYKARCRRGSPIARRPMAGGWAKLGCKEKP